MKLTIASLFLTLPTAVVANNLNQITKVQKQNSQSLAVISNISAIRERRSSAQWFAENFKNGWIPIYGAGFTQDFIYKAIFYLGELHLFLKNNILTNEENQPDHYKTEQYKERISSEKNAVELMSAGVWAGIFVTGPLCENLKNRFWDVWQPIYEEIEKFLYLN